MGTSIKINVWREEETTDEQWDLLKDYFLEKFNEPYIEENIIESGLIYCSFHNADLDKQIDEELLKKLKGSGLTFNLWFEEREPDETLEVK